MTSNYKLIELPDPASLKIKEEWENRQDEVIKYCIKDADLTLRIYEKLRVVDRNISDTCGIGLDSR